MIADPVCELCGTDEVFRTRLWKRVCLGCGKSHTVCGSCLSDWGLRLRVPAPRSNWNHGGRCPHLDCPDAARVAQELMRPERIDTGDLLLAAGAAASAMRAFGTSLSAASRAARDLFVSTGAGAAALENLADLMEAERGARR